MTALLATNIFQAQFYCFLQPHTNSPQRSDVSAQVESTAPGGDEVQKMLHVR